MATKQPPEFVACPFTVIVDTREQAAFEFRDIDNLKRYGGGRLIIRTQRKGLPTGDYSILGMENRISIERKEMGDFFHCCGGDRERFAGPGGQLDRLNQMECGIMMVEASMDMIMRGHRESQLDPESVRGSVIAWQQDYYPNVHWWFCGGKRLAEVTTFRILDRWWRSNEV